MHEAEKKYRITTINRRLARIERLLLLIANQGKHIMSTQAEANALQATLVADVAAEKDVVNSAVTLISGFKQQLADAIAAFQVANPAVDVSGFTVLHQSIADQTTALANAVAAGTPAAPAAPTP